MTPEVQRLIRRLEELVYQAECCAQAQSTLADRLIEARSIVDRLQILSDREDRKQAGYAA